MANVAMLVTLEQILEAIQSLPAAEQRQLRDRLDHDSSESAAHAKPGAPIEPIDFIGFLGSEPALADEILKIGTVEREREDLREWDGAEGRS